MQELERFHLALHHHGSLQEELGNQLNNQELDFHNPQRK